LKKKYKENLGKNILLLILFLLLFNPIKSYFLEGGLVINKASAGNILVAISIIAVLAGFGNFGFKYDKVDLQNPVQRYFAHVITGIFMFVIGICLVITGILISLIMGHFVLIDIILFLLYVSCVGFDFWDLVSVENGELK